MLALREGDLAQAAGLMGDVLTQFPDPTFGDRILDATSGDMGPTNVFGPFFAAYGNWVLGRYGAVLEDAGLALLMDDQLPELYLMQGFAHCNLGEDEAAEAAYTQAIALDPDFTVLYLLRADVRFRLGNAEGTQQDAATLQHSSLSDALYPYAQSVVLSGDLSCHNFFAYEFAPAP
jgi:tetratricopeptide (TPR) repeat protein